MSAEAHAAIAARQNAAIAATPNAAVAATLAAWHRMIASGDLADLPALVAPEAVFRSPMAFKPYQSAEAVVLILRTVSGVFQNFRYHRELFSSDGLNAVLEFSAEVGGKQLKGIDLIAFDAQGRIAEFEVMVRPMSGLAALGEAMGARIGAVLPGYKS
jgi:2,4-dienoyl-CoA reductase (NADPH2)